MTKNQIPFNVPVTVRVKGQSKRLTRVTLVPLADRQAQTENARRNGITTDTHVRVLTGKRGRPSYLPLERISNVKVLAAA